MRDFKTPITVNGESVSTFRSASGRRISIYNPYARSGSNQYKGQLHAHSTNSFDTGGANSPTQVVNAYKTAGYGFISLTDHDVNTADPGVTGITFIPGIEEYANPDLLAKGHITVFNTTINSSSDVAQTVIDDHRKVGGLATLAHPNLQPYHDGPEELLNLERYSFIEVFNQTGAADLQLAEDKWDFALTYGKRVYGIAVDDVHDVAGAAFNKGWVTVNANTNTLSTITAELEAGNFYASNGATLTVSVSGAVITATSGASATIDFIGRNGQVLKTASATTSSTYTIVGDETYVRVRVTNTSGGLKAWSQPIFVEAADGANIATLISHSATVGQYRNALINGNFDVWQRGGGPYTANGMTADRWRLVTSNVTTYQVMRYDASDEYGRACMRITQTTKGAGTPDVAVIQALESNDCHVFKSKTVTFSVLMRRNASFNAGTAAIAIYQGQGTDEQLVSTNRVTTTKSVAFSEISENKWTRVWVTASVRSTTTQLGVVVRLNDTNTPNTSYIEIKQAQLNLGVMPALFQPYSLHDELMKCYRYFYRWSKDTSSGAVQSPPSSVTTTGVTKIYFKFPVMQRTSVAASVTGTRGTDWTLKTAADAVNTTGSVGIETGPRDYGLLRFESGTYTAGTSMHVLMSTTSGWVQWDAEL
jgi:hypothetical protein